MILTPAFPMVPIAGSANAPGLNQNLPCGKPGPPAGRLAYGSPTTLMRGVSLAEPVMSRAFVVVKVGVKGEPVEKVVIPDRFQPSTTIPSGLLLNFFPNFGRS